MRARSNHKIEGFPVEVLSRGCAMEICPYRLISEISVNTQVLSAQRLKTSGTKLLKAVFFIFLFFYFFIFLFFYFFIFLFFYFFIFLFFYLFFGWI
jgi:hypothetical protein